MIWSGVLRAKQWPVQHVKQDANGWKNNMSDQEKECGCASNDLLLKLIEQNNQLIQQNNQLIQINNEQNAQINELLIQMDGDEDEQPKSPYLDWVMKLPRLQSKLQAMTPKANRWWYEQYSIMAQRQANLKWTWI